MLAVERKNRIVEYVRDHRVATIGELAKAFTVHEATIRRDVNEIVREGLLKRTHGGVTVEEWTNAEASFNERFTKQLEQKMLIGKKAAEMVNDGEHIIIDSGTTTLHIAKNLIHRTNLTVVTNDMNVAAELKDSPGIHVILTGGELYPSSYMLNGMFTEKVLDSLHVHKAFIGIPVLHSRFGLMHPEARLVPTKQSMIRAAENIIVVADDSKLGKVSLHTVASNEQIDTLITGGAISQYDKEQYGKSGVEVIIV